MYPNAGVHDHPAACTHCNYLAEQRDLLWCMQWRSDMCGIGRNTSLYLQLVTFGRIIIHSDQPVCRNIYLHYYGCERMYTHECLYDHAANSSCTRNLGSTIHLR